MLLILTKIKDFQFKGLYNNAILLINITIQTVRLTKLLYYLLILLLQSCYYNNNLILLAKQTILNLILNINNLYYSCKFYLAYGSVIFRYMNQAKYNACIQALKNYNISKYIYQLNLIKNNLIFINDRLLYAKILINILIISNIQILLALLFKAELVVDFLLKLIYPNKKYFFVLQDDKKYIINYNISVFLLNLFYLLQYINDVKNVLFKQYYYNLYVVVLSHIISDIINYSITQCYVFLRIVDVVLIINLIIDTNVATINFSTLSFSNKQNFIISINKTISVFTHLLVKIYYATNIIKQNKLYSYFKLNFLLFKLNNFTILLKILKFDLIQKKVFLVDVAKLLYKFKHIGDLLKILIILLYVYIFNVCLYYYNLVFNIYKQINKDLIVNNLYAYLVYTYILIFNLIYNNFFLYLESDLIYKKLTDLRIKLALFIYKKLNESVVNQLVLTYVTVLHFISQYHFFNLHFYEYILIKSVIELLLQNKLLLKNYSLYLNINQQYKDSLVNVKRILLLKQSNVMLLNFTHILAHDMKTPLRTISSYAQLLKSLKDLLYIDLIINNTKSLYNLVDSSLKYVSIDKLINKTLFDLLYLLILIIKQYSSLISKKNIVISIKLLDSFPKLYADKLLIKTVIQNLLTNSIKACNKENSTILFGCLNLNWFYIKDNGRGIKPENKLKIFNLFYRQHKIDLYGKLILGTGFGLAIVKRILLKHLSIVRVLSLLNLGTMIMFSLNNLKC